MSQTWGIQETTLGTYPDGHPRTDWLREPNGRPCVWATEADATAEAESLTRFERMKSYRARPATAALPRRW